MSRITIILDEPYKIALITLAEREFREPQAQAALIICQALEKEGLIKTAMPAPVASEASLPAPEDKNED